MRPVRAHLRWRIAYLLNRLPWTCWAELVQWVRRDKSDRLYLTWGERMPAQPGGLVCRRESLTHRDGSCWCGKFRDPQSAVSPTHETEAGA